MLILVTRYTGTGTCPCGAVGECLVSFDAHEIVFCDPHARLAVEHAFLGGGVN